MSSRFRRIFLPALFALALVFSGVNLTVQSNASGVPAVTTDVQVPVVLAWENCGTEKAEDDCEEHGLPGKPSKQPKPEPPKPHKPKPEPKPAPQPQPVPAPVPAPAPSVPVAPVAPSTPAVTTGGGGGQSFAYVCVVSKTDTQIIRETVRTLDANALKAENPGSYDMPVGGDCGISVEDKPRPAPPAVVAAPLAPVVEQPALSAPAPLPALPESFMELCVYVEGNDNPWVIEVFPESLALALEEQGSHMRPNSAGICGIGEALVVEAPPVVEQVPAEIPEAVEAPVQIPRD